MFEGLIQRYEERERELTWRREHALHERIPGVPRRTAADRIVIVHLADRVDPARPGARVLAPLPHARPVERAVRTEDALRLAPVERVPLQTRQTRTRRPLSLGDALRVGTARIRLARADLLLWFHCKRNHTPTTLKRGSPTTSDRGKTKELSDSRISPGGNGMG